MIRRDWQGIPMVPAINSPRGYYADGSDILRLDQVQVGVKDGMVVRKWNRRAPSSDYDLTRRLYRRYIGTGSQDVQLRTGTEKMLRSGYRWPYRGAGWFHPVPPFMPGYEPSFAGWPVRGPDPWSMARQFVQGPGRNPINPGGPATIAGIAYENPMTG